MVPPLSLHAGPATQPVIPSHLGGGQEVATLLKRPNGAVTFMSEGTSRMELLQTQCKPWNQSGPVRRHSHHSCLFFKVSRRISPSYLLKTDSVTSLGLSFSIL